MNPSDPTAPDANAPAKPQLRLRKAGSATPDPVREPPPIPAAPKPPKPPNSPANPAPPPPPTNGDRPRKKANGLVAYTVPAAWILFLLLGGAMAALRYGDFVDVPRELFEYGPYAILFFHVVVVLLAFQEDLFAGVLCILLPGYSLYYLVMRANRPFFTALVFGLLAGFGEDTWEILHKYGMDFYESTTKLMHGG
jgi:hypothetical protein